MGPELAAGITALATTAGTGANIAAATKGSALPTPGAPNFDLPKVAPAQMTFPQMPQQMPQTNYQVPNVPIAPPSNGLADLLQKLSMGAR